MTPDELIVTVASLFPRAFSDETAVSKWLDTYRRTLGHLTPAQLRKAWDQTIAKWEKTSPPMPKHILDNAPIATRMAADGVTKSMRSLAGIIDAMIADLVEEWWTANAAWFASECEARQLTTADERAANWWINQKLKNRAQYQAQRRYWKDDTSPLAITKKDIQSVFSLAIGGRCHESPFRSTKAGLNSLSPKNDDGAVDRSVDTVIDTKVAKSG